MKAKYFLLSVFMGAFGACLGQNSLVVTVRDADTRQPLPGATIQVDGTSAAAVTDEYGRARLAGLSGGQAILTVRYTGYKLVSDTLTSVGRDLEILLEQQAAIMGEVIVSATRSDAGSPSTFTTLNRGTLQKQNFGQDLPFALTWTPSLVTTSDAGTGVGYTGFRIRGSDPTRINVTVNGIPLNDSESQAVYWVNMPDFLSSVQSVQVQRGVGTSTNGAGAFGATVNLQSLSYRPEPYAEVQAAAGSFGTRRFTAKVGTGLIGNWSFEGRLSDIQSDGYVDRASADLNAYYVSGGYFGKRTKVQFLSFGGHEVTYQAWYGVDRETMATNRTFNYAGAIYDSLGQIDQYYENEVDDYTQKHWQLHLYHELRPYWTVQASLNRTDGYGFFEQYRQDQNRYDLGLADIVLGTEVITNNDFVVRRWLDNRLYAGTLASQYEGKRFELIVGGAYSEYEPARHYGEIVWAEFAGAVQPGSLYYDGQSRKTDITVYSKGLYHLSDKWNVYADIQYRGVVYQSAGKDADQSYYLIDDTFDFFNPKAGITYTPSSTNLYYINYALAHREPTRADYLDGEDVPRAETLHNAEAGWKYNSSKLTMETNGFLMAYRNQLVFTGEVNDTGYPVRANVGESYRTGIEWSATAFLGKSVSWSGNAAWSVNKNKSVRVGDADGNLAEFTNTDIVLSPRWVAGSQLSWSPLGGLQLTWMSKYVDRQYLDNSENRALSLDPYWVNDLRASWSFRVNGLSSIEVSALVNNVLNMKYESNGYAYGGAAYLFPQAGRNFLVMLALKI
jgi:iron complex outermembrane receptor protein